MADEIVTGSAASIGTGIPTDAETRPTQSANVVKDASFETPIPTSLVRVFSEAEGNQKTGPVPVTRATSTVCGVSPGSLTVH
jgi:hypothetical protein